MLALAAALGPLKAANRLVGRRLFGWRLESRDGAPVPCGEGWPVPVDPPVDPPGPPCPTTWVCAGEAPETAIPGGLPDQLRQIWRRGGTVGAMGSGAFALAAAGILAGHRFTLHWDHLPLL